MRNSRPYFHPRKFIGNNIEFRIGSSSALSRFKEGQTFILDQLALNPYHKFSTTAKEILLLKYDVWWDFVNELEQYLLVSHEQGICVDEIIKLSDIRVDYYNEVLRSQSELIDQRYFEIWNAMHTDLYDHLISVVRKICETDMTRAGIFGSIVDILSKVLNHTIFELQELDIVYYTKKTPEINLDDLSCDFVSENGNCLIWKRLTKLKTIRDFDEVIIKNYLSEKIPFKLTNLYQRLKENSIDYTLV